MKARYNRQSVLNYLFEFAYQFNNYCKLPHSDDAYEAVISWKMAGMVAVLRKRYDKHTSLAYMTVSMPAVSNIPPTLQYERNNWIDYWKRQAKLQPGLLK